VPADVVASILRGDREQAIARWQATIASDVQRFAVRTGCPSLQAMRIVSSTSRDWVAAFSSLTEAEAKELSRALELHVDLRGSLSSETLREARDRILARASNYPATLAFAPGPDRDAVLRLALSDEPLWAAYQLAVDASLPLSTENIALLRSEQYGKIPRSEFHDALFEFGRVIGFQQAAELLGLSNGEELRRFAQTPAWDSGRLQIEGPQLAERVDELLERVRLMEADLQRERKSWAGSEVQQP
jgi:hypothetical protein